VGIKNSSLFDEFVCKLHTNELNTTFFGSTSPLKAPNRLKSLKLARRFVLTSCASCDIYKIRSHRRKFSNSDRQKTYFMIPFCS
jgi:hypothetical protein